MNAEHQRIAWFTGYFSLIALTGLYVWYANEQTDKLRYSVTCYTNGDTPIYEGVAAGKVSGDSEVGFHFTDTNNQRQRIAANCIITSLPSVN